MATITRAIHQQKAIYLVPFPFMADNKYNHFTDLYASCGLDIVISSRTRKEDDHKIINGDYDLAVIVYKKFNYFLLMYPDFLKDASLLIIDEMQMINDHRKGPLLESMIDIIRNRKLNLKIIALSALIANSSSLKKFLSAQLLTSFQRPVELRKGTVRKGPRANQAIDEFYQIEDTFSRKKLLTLLEKGIAYYNSDLAWEEKDLIETYVKKGEIKVVCAAITLAMEITPTFKNVILATEKLCIEKEGYQNNHHEPLSLIDIENIGGKAGILNKLIKDKNLRKVGKKEEFGRLIFLAPTNLQETILNNLYFNLIDDYYLQENERFAKYYLMEKPAINNYIDTNASEDNWLLQNFDFGENNINSLEKNIEINLKKLVDYGLITPANRGRFLLTPVGTLIITKDIKVETYLDFKVWLDSIKEEEISNLEIIQILTSSSDGKRFSIPNLQISDREKTLLLYDWIENREIKSIQQEYGLQANSIQRLGKSFSWLADSLAAVAESIGWDKDKPKSLEKIKQRVDPFSPPSPTKNYKPKTRNLKLKTDNRQPKTVLHIDQNRPDRIIFLGKEVKLTNMGFSLLYLLAQHRGQVLNYEEILEELWENEENAIYTRINYHICKIRKDISKVINNKRKVAKKIENIFKTIPGRGLMLNIEGEELKLI